MTTIGLLKLRAQGGGLALFPQQVQQVGLGGSEADAPGLLQALGFPSVLGQERRLLTAAGKGGARRWLIGGPLEPLEVERTSLRRCSRLLGRLHFPPWLGGFCLLPDRSLLLLVDLDRVVQGVSS